MASKKSVTAPFPFKAGGVNLLKTGAKVLEQWPLLLALLIFCSCAQGAPVYQVEAIIFQQEAPDYSSEPLDPEALPSLTKAQTLHRAASTSESDPYTLLPEKQWCLTQEAWALQHKGKKRILFHSSWIQPITGSGKAIPLAIQGGYIYNEAGDIMGEMEGDGLYSAHPTELTGSLALTYQQRFINAQIHLTLQDFQRGRFISIAHLKQHQRMREGELHYFDNAQLGVLIKVLPYSSNTNDL